MAYRIRTRAGLVAAAALAFGLATAPALASEFGDADEWGQAPAVVQQDDDASYARPAGWGEGPRGHWGRGDWGRDRGREWRRPGWGHPRYAEDWRPRRWGPPCRMEMERVWTGWGWRERPVRRCW